MTTNRIEITSPAMMDMAATSFRPGSCGWRRIQLSLVNIQSQIDPDVSRIEIESDQMGTKERRQPSTVSGNPKGVLSNKAEG